MFSLRDKKMARKPSELEKRQIILAIGEKYNFDEFDMEYEHYKEVINDAYIAIFDHYITDCPGYAGKVALMVWQGSPKFFNCFTFNNEKAILQLKDE